MADQQDTSAVTSMDIDTPTVSKNNGILDKIFLSCAPDPKGSVHRAWGISLLFVVVYFSLSIFESKFGFITNAVLPCLSLLLFAIRLPCLRLFLLSAIPYHFENIFFLHRIEHTKSIWIWIVFIPFHSISVVLAWSRSIPNSILFASRNNSGELAKIRRCVSRTHRCCYLDGIDTPGLGCPRYICPQTISDILFGRILSGCPGSSRQPKHHFVRLLSQIHAGKWKCQSGLCLSGISSLFGPDLYDVTPGAFQKRCRVYISHGQCPKRRWKRKCAGVMEPYLWNEWTNDRTAAKSS